MCTWVEDGLGDEGSHDLGQWCIVFPAPVEDVLDDLGELIHLYIIICNC